MTAGYASAPRVRLAIEDRDGELWVPSKSVEGDAADWLRVLPRVWRVFVELCSDTSDSGRASGDSDSGDSSASSDDL